MGVRVASRSSLCVAIKQEVAPEPLQPSVRKGQRDGGIQKSVLFSPAVFSSSTTRQFAACQSKKRTWLILINNQKTWKKTN